MRVRDVKIDEHHSRRNQLDGRELSVSCVPEAIFGEIISGFVISTHGFVYVYTDHYELYMRLVINGKDCIHIQTAQGLTEKR